MNEVSIFKFEESFTVRTVTKDNEPWFVAKDICDVLGLTNITEALRNLEDDERGSEFLNTSGGRQKVVIISESGLYALVIRSNKPNARKFRKWITSEVLPSIRKTGKYAAPVQPELPLQASQTDMETQTGARKLQMLLDGSRIKHKQLFCTEIIPAEKKEMPIAERKRPGKTRVKMLFPDIPIGLETRTELGELARAFAERDPEHGLAPYAEYIAYRTMFRKIRLIRQSVEKIDQCGADVSVLSDRSISGAMIL